MSDIYKRASRAKIRFTTDRGSVAVEDLWDIPLLSKNGICLDNIAKALNKSVKLDVDEESFVTTAIKKPTLENLKLDIVKDVIKTQLEAGEARANRALKKANKEKILALIADKENDELRGLSKEDLLKMVNDL